MSAGIIMIWIFIAFYLGMGLGTLMKHNGQLNGKYALFCMFALPAKVIVKAFALLPMICTVVYAAYFAKKEKLNITKDGEEDFAFTIGRDFFE